MTDKIKDIIESTDVYDKDIDLIDYELIENGFKLISSINEEFELVAEDDIVWKKALIVEKDNQKHSIFIEGTATVLSHYPSAPISWFYVSEINFFEHPAN